MCVCLCIPHIDFCMPEPIFTKLGMYIIASEAFSPAYFIYPSYRSVCLYVYPLSIFRRLLVRNVAAATNTRNSRIAGRFILYAVLLSNESRRLVIP
jgi:hypothetical protein